jgi:hypothetical protein
MNIRKLMARLNAKAPQFSVGSGGVPEYTAQDIAAALGMVEDVIGREIFCMSWWPDGAALTRKDLKDGLKNLLLEEYKVRSRELAARKLEAHMLDVDAIDGGRRRHAKLRSEIQSSKPWPAQLDRYGLVADAVVLEICTPKICRTCGGRGEATIESKIVVCETCKGSGLIPASQGWRANRIEVSETTYRSAWRQVYEWLYERASTRESTAAKQLAIALGSYEQAA